MYILYNRLITALNEKKPDSTEFYIAKMMIWNLWELPRMSISDVAKMCAVSKSTISKFVRDIGFEDYLDFKAAINDLKNNQGANAVVVFYHWGIEREYYANSDQRELAKFSIDSGADLVMGSHPHVVQGTEEYNGKQIVYSLGNFCFGGNRNPSDTDSMIYSITMNFTDGVYTGDSHEIIPCSVTAVKGRNNYQPIILEGNEKERVLTKIQKYSY